LGTLSVMLAVLCGCSGVYYSTMEKLGYPKREMLVDRVQKARDAQEEAKEQFQSALEEFTAVTGYQGGDLEKMYNRLRDQLQRSESMMSRASARPSLRNGSLNSISTPAANCGRSVRTSFARRGFGTPVWWRPCVAPR